ncbi:hypothetical protein IEO21_07895 [Rhodonia placenta]|uniref:Uncharacterized protein n=1 Tax=Rhodonia placenta TaxID=104341 RepID=A0A8H7NX72_9APHY|nr:hypothetical protein IEO21_07895 [Postia placenta]
MRVQYKAKQTGILGYPAAWRLSASELSCACRSGG